MKPLPQILRTPLLAVLCLGVSRPAHTQQKGEPGKFDFYLVNMVPASEFCLIKDVGPHCKPPRYGVVLHGLWPQNNNGTYPVFCGTQPGPAQPERYLRLTPDADLIRHEWAKHGTCTTLSVSEFFAAEKKALHVFKMPAALERPRPELVMRTDEVISLLYKANPGFPPGSIILWCSDRRLTSMSACLSKHLEPLACQGLKTCMEDSLTIGSPASAVNQQ